MASITVELLRKRAEHNDGEVSSLREVSLHQQELKRIELLGSVCRHLQILYLQCNLIPRIENVGRLKELSYLNLAVNNIQRIEGLERCESLQKLDLTVNFVPKEGLLDLHLLRANEFLNELHLLGNPCADWHGYRRLVAAELPQLFSLDGQPITPSERIQAQQDAAQLKQTLVRELIEEGKDPSYRPQPRRVEDEDEDFEAVDPDAENEPDTAEWSPLVRIRDHKRQQKHREQTERRKQQSSSLSAHLDGAAEPGAPKRRERLEPLEDSESLPLQKNEGGWTFSLDESEDGSSVVLRVPVGKFLDTSLLEVDVRPFVVRVLIKGRLLLLRLSAEVSTDASVAERSTASGELVVTMPKTGSGACAGIHKPNEKVAERCHRSSSNNNGHDLQGRIGTRTGSAGHAVPTAVMRGEESGDESEEEPPPLL